MIAGRSVGLIGQLSARLNVIAPTHSSLRDYIWNEG